MKSAFLSLLIILSTSLPTSTFQLGSDIIKIKVLDQRGHALIGANITGSKDGSVIFRGTTDFDGIFSVEVDVEQIDIQVSLPGYKSEEIKSVKTSDKLITIVLKRASPLEEIFYLDDTDSKTKKAYDSEPSLPSTMSISSDGSRSSGSPLRKYSSQKKLPGSGQVTAAEWNDLHNWREWKKLIGSEEYRSMMSTWNINTSNRFSVLVLNKEDVPLPGAVIKLLDKNGVLIWQSHTDVSGKSELYQGSFGESNEVHQILIAYRGKSETIRQINHSDRGAMIARLDVPCPDLSKVDISWIVDATSSMSDEIEYLQSELLDVINRVKSNNKDIRWSSIFYRDSGDEYITKISPFTDDEEITLDFIKAQEAKGGGDFPEAVSDAVHEMVSELNWRPDSEVKLCFLLLDAPPHDDLPSMNKYRQSVQEAAVKGIKIIPITASGINRETEFLMKFTSILTNGTYVFITDDSGIGNPHLDPVVKDYEVEKLNDLLVRLIRSYTTPSDCNEYISENKTRKIRFYPNPASDLITIENLMPQDKVQLISTSGMIVKSVSIEQDKFIRFDISELVSGNYLLRIKGTDQTRDFRLLVIT